MTDTRFVWRVGGFVFTALVIALWQIQANLGLISPIYLPSPQRAMNALINGFSGGLLLDRLIATMERMIFGWVLASLLGVVLGSIIGISKVARSYLEPMLDYLRPMPASAIIPVMIPILGLTETMVLTVIGFSALWPTLLATIHGFSSIEPRLNEVARILKLGRTAFIWKIALPNALPDIIAGSRISLTYALILSVVGEMLSGREGLGQFILSSARLFKAPDLFAGVLLLGLLGYLSALLVAQLEKRLLTWRKP
ncbi:ABC transporter permease [Rhizobium sp. BK060]|uniref:ABC transporter permease n=1 Tax=Rhizobium sp. BK060 TaxID=2587096 RepID=UPI0016146F6C|nr:ABC transporter permease [Rhizobium sp. BK060]MBB3396023.1 ABC-type nitrate/sulfonate/bicarbonate transport system permease component [Rhizobium sp. BK060]